MRYGVDELFPGSEIGSLEDGMSPFGGERISGPVELGVMISGWVAEADCVVVGEMMIGAGVGGTNGFVRPISPTSTSRPDNGRSFEKVASFETSTFGSKVTAPRCGGTGGTGYGAKLLVMNQ